MSMALSEVELTRVADDPYVHFGDLLQLVHLETGHAVASDVNDRDMRPGEEACAATAAPEVRAPCPRNTFVLLKYAGDPGAPREQVYEDDVLHYGQKIRLALNPASLGEDTTADGGTSPLCLFSKLLSSNHFAKYSRKQLVGLTFRNTYDTVWQVRAEPVHQWHASLPSCEPHDQHACMQQMHACVTCLHATKCRICRCWWGAAIAAPR